MKEYRNFIILGALFAICLLAGVHASHDEDLKLLDFSLDAAKEILAAILTVTTITVAGKRSTDGEKNHTVEAPNQNQKETK